MDAPLDLSRASREELIALVLRQREQEHPITREPGPPVPGGVQGQGRVEAERRAIRDAGGEQLRQIVQLR